MKESRCILIVEEDFIQMMLLERAFHNARIPNPIQIARHLDEAICYLNGTGVYASRHHYPFPTLVLLGLKAHTGIGLKLLAWIRSQPQFDKLLIVALGGDNLSREMQTAYDLGANAYFQPGKDEAEIVRLVQELEVLEDVESTFEVSAQDNAI